MLKLQYFGHLMQRANSLEKTLMLEKIEGRRRMGQQRIKWLDGITDSMSLIITSGGQSTGTSASLSILPVNIQGSVPLELTGLISVLSKGLSRDFFSTTI